MQLDEKHLSFLNQGQTSDFIQFRLEFKLEFERLVSSITRLKTLETRILRISSRDINPYKLKWGRNNYIEKFRYPTISKRKTDRWAEGGRAKCGKSRARERGRGQSGKTLGSAESGLRGRRGERREESTPKIGSNKLSTIFAGLNTLKRLEIRLGGGPFVHGAPCRPGMKDCNVLSRKRDENRVQLSKPSSRTVFRDSPPTLTKIYIHI